MSAMEVVKHGPLQLFSAALCLLAACSAQHQARQGESDGHDRGRTGKDASAAREDTPMMTAAGTSNPCPLQPDVRALDWETSTDFSSSPAEAFGALARKCEGELVWSQAALDVLGRSAPSEDEVQVALSVDEASARITRPQPPSGGLACRPFLEIGVKVQLTTKSGVVDESFTSILRYTPGLGAMLLQLAAPFTLDDGSELGTAHYSLQMTEAGCDGELSIQRSSGAGLATTFLANWSGTR